MSESAVNRIPETVFSTDPLERKERFPIWRDSISVLFDVDLSKRQDNEKEFSASVHSYLLGPLMLATCRTRGHEWVRSASHHMRDGIDHYLIQLFERGKCHVNATDKTAEEGDILVLDAGQDMHTETQEFQNLSLIVPRSMISEHLNAPDEHASRVISGKTPLAALLADHLRSLRNNAGDMTLAEANSVVEPSIMLAAQVLNGAVSSQPEIAAAVKQTQLNQIKRFIEDQLMEPTLNPDELCRTFGLSRSQLYRMFESLGGVAGYIRDRRLWRAMSDLVKPGNQYMRVADIAYKWGFSSEADFSRAFKRLFGFSPSHARGENFANLNTGEGDANPADVDRGYEEWLRGLSRV